MNTEIIDDIQNLESPANVGVAISSTDGVVQLMGLETIFLGELVVFQEVDGVVLNLEASISGIAILGSEDEVKMGDIASRTFQEVLMPVGVGILGCVLDPLGRLYADS